MSCFLRMNYKNMLVSTHLIPSLTPFADGVGKECRK